MIQVMKRNDIQISRSLPVKLGLPLSVAAFDRAGYGLTHLLAGCRKRRLNHALSVLSYLRVVFF